MGASGHLPVQLGKEVSVLIAQPMVCARPNNGSRRAFQHGDMQQVRWPAFDRRLLDPCMRPHSLGKKRCADLMEPHAGLQDEPRQHFRLRHMANTLNLYLADFQQP